MTFARLTWESPYLLRFRRDRLAVTGLIFLAFIALLALIGPAVLDATGAPGPYERDNSALDAFGAASGPSASHWFGVDGLGRDVLSRIVHGARVSLGVAILATSAAVAIGVVLGLVAGYSRGILDTVISRIIDLMLAIPYLLLALGLAASCSIGDGCLGGAIKPGVGVVVFVIAVTSWTYIARIVRGETLTLRESQFVEAARASGASTPRVVFGEILPNLASPVIVYASLLIPQVILYEAALSFLGVGIQPPTSSWGQMLSDAAAGFGAAWWYMIFPGLAIALTVLAFNVVGDAMRDALNPRNRPTQ